jgi:hypothetical protein
MCDIKLNSGNNKEKIKDRIYTYFGGLHKSPRILGYVNKPVSLNENKLIFHFYKDEESSANELEGKLLTVIKSTNKKSWWNMVISIYTFPYITMIVIGVMILVMLGFLHTFEESFYEVIKGELDESSSIATWNSLFLSLGLLLAVLLISPVRLNIEEVDPKKKVSDFFSGKKRAEIILSSLVRSIVLNCNISQIEIWEPENIENWLVMVLLESASALSVESALIISAVNRPDDILKMIPEGRVVVFDSASLKQVISGSSNRALSIIPLLTKQEREIFYLIPDCVEPINKKSVALSQSLLEIASNAAVTESRTDDVIVSQFLERLVRDCGVGSFREEGFILQADDVAKISLTRKQISHVKVDIMKVIERFPDFGWVDSVACIVLLRFLLDAKGLKHYSKKVLLLIERLAFTIVRDDEYIFGQALCEIIETFNKRYSNILVDDIFIEFTPKMLDKILYIYERSGLFGEAHRVLDALMLINEIKYGVKKARLLERTGEGDLEKGYQLISHIVDRVRMGRYQNRITLVSVYIEAGWIYVNSKKAGANILVRRFLYQAYQEIIQLDENLPMISALVWRYWNIMYNLYEIEKEFYEAYRCLLRCLKVPGVDIKWRSGTYTNLGIAHRNLWEEDRMDICELKSALSCGRKGFFMKRRMRDFDEIPISGYHLALSMKLFLEARMDNSVVYKGQIVRILEESLNVLNQTSSNKKRHEIELLLNELSG